MSQPFRLDQGGVIDPAKSLRFTFDGEAYEGCAGDTLASALLANGVHLVGRSFKYHRPRGILSAGVEEPNALVRIGEEPHVLPNTKATTLPLYDGLVARSQNAWPSLEFDMLGLADWLSPLMPAGFYYKTFMGPGKNGWHLYEPFLRKAAGFTPCPREPDPDRYDKLHAFCDLLVVGGGPAGLMAALAAAKAGCAVILADEQPQFGGHLLDEGLTLDGCAPREWVRTVVEQLEALPNVTLLKRTTVCGRYLHHSFGMLVDNGPWRARQQWWHVRARQAVLATGALERPLLFADNDRPGIMLASAVKTYLRRFGVKPGTRVVVATNNDSAYDTAAALSEAGVDVAAVADTRSKAPEGYRGAVLDGARIVRVQGRRRVRAVVIRSGGALKPIACDLLCMSGGWSPVIHLYAQGEIRPVYHEAWGAFVADPKQPVEGLRCAGVCAALDDEQEILGSGWRSGAEAARALGYAKTPEFQAPKVERGQAHFAMASEPVAEYSDKAFVDFQNDIKVADIRLSIQEGYRSVEHVKRYTTLGMGTDQGKTANLPAMSVMAGALNKPLAEVGTTTFRPPYTPMTLGALAGRESHERIAPVRKTPMHAWHTEHGAHFMPSGLWARPQYFKAHGRSCVEAATVEARNVREHAGIADVSTLGKIDIQGADAAEFLNRIYTSSRWKTLRAGRIRYGLMLRPDGYVFDDGTTTRLAEDHFYLTSTTGNAGAVMSHLEYYRQVIWPELDVKLTSVTDQWAAVALAGPGSRKILRALFEGLEVSNETLPFMSFLETELHGIQARIFRISFSGELAYEIAVPADYGLALWKACLAVGEEFHLMPYGLEAMDYLRIEKGHLVVGMDIDGRVSPYDLGLGGLCSKKTDYVGRRSLKQAVFHDENRQQLAGFRSTDGQSMIASGAQLVRRPFDGRPQESLGRITSRGFSPSLDAPIALGLISGGAKHHGEKLYAVSPVTHEMAEVEVGPPVFYDPSGERMKG